MAGKPVRIAASVIAFVVMTHDAQNIPGKAQFTSKYRRLERLVSHKKNELLCDCVARLIISYAAEAHALELVIDRTNWKLGSKPINVLFVGVLIGDSTSPNAGIYIPLLWEALPKHGSSSQKERTTAGGWRAIHAGTILGPS